MKIPRDIYHGCVIWFSESGTIDVSVHLEGNSKQTVYTPIVKISESVPDRDPAMLNLTPKQMRAVAKGLQEAAKWVEQYYRSEK